MPLRVLMVAEKPSIAQAIAGALSPDGRWSKRRGISPSAPCFDFQGDLVVGGQRHEATITATSTVGHMWSLDFPKEYNDQNRVDPVDLFDAPTMHFEDPRPRMSQHLAQEANGADVLVLWLGELAQRLHAVWSPLSRPVRWVQPTSTLDARRL